MWIKQFSTLFSSFWEIRHLFNQLLRYFGVHFMLSNETARCNLFIYFGYSLGCVNVCIGWSILFISGSRPLLKFLTWFLRIQSILDSWSFATKPMLQSICSCGRCALNLACALANIQYILDTNRSHQAASNNWQSRTFSLYSLVP